jgi:hypothetical protein
LDSKAMPSSPIPRPTAGGYFSFENTEEDQLYERTHASEVTLLSVMSPMPGL